jgi:hypothetical protein
VWTRATPGVGGLLNTGQQVGDAIGLAALAHGWPGMTRRTARDEARGAPK